MTIRKIDEFLFLCKESGFKTPAEVQDYEVKEGIECKRLYEELDALCFPEWISKEVNRNYVKCL